MRVYPLSRKNCSSKRRIRTLYKAPLDQLIIVVEDKPLVSADVIVSLRENKAVSIVANSAVVIAAYRACEAAGNRSKRPVSAISDSADR